MEMYGSNLYKAVTLNFTLSAWDSGYRNRIFFKSQNNKHWVNGEKLYGRVPGLVDRVFAARAGSRLPPAAQVRPIFMIQ